LFEKFKMKGARGEICPLELATEQGNGLEISVQEIFWEFGSKKCFLPRQSGRCINKSLDPGRRHEVEGKQRPQRSWIERWSPDENKNNLAPITLSGFSKALRKERL